MELIKKITLMFITLCLIMGTTACESKQDTESENNFEAVESDENLCIIRDDISKGPLVTIEKNEMLGALDNTGKQILPFEYEQIRYLGEGRYELMKRDENDKAVSSIVDDKGQEASAPDNNKQDNINNESNQPETEKAIRKDAEIVFVFPNGDECRPEAHTDQEELEFVNKRAAIVTDWDYAKSVGVIDTDGKMIIPPEYTDVRFEKDFIAADESLETDDSGNDKGLWEIFDYDGNRISDNKYSEIKVYENGVVVKNEEDIKYGILETDGREKEPCEFDFVYSSENDSKIAGVLKDKTIGFINEDGEIIYSPDFPADKIEIRTILDNGLAVARKTPEGGWGLISTDGTEVTEFVYEISEGEE